MKFLSFFFQADCEWSILLFIATQITINSIHMLYFINSLNLQKSRLVWWLIKLISSIWIQAKFSCLIYEWVKPKKFLLTFTYKWYQHKPNCAKKCKNIKKKRIETHLCGQFKAVQGSFFKQWTDTNWPDTFFWPFWHA